MRVYGWGVFNPRRWRMLCVLTVAFLACLAAPGTLQAQTTVLLNVPDSQVIDTTIRNGAYATYNHNNTVLLTRSSTVPDWERRTIVSFNASSIPTGVTVTSATLTLKVRSGLGTSGATRPVAVRRLTASFVEGQATWLNRSSSVRWTTPGGDLGETITSANVSNVAGTVISFNVTALVQRAVNGEFSRQVMMALIDTGGGGDAKDSYREYHSTEAYYAADRPQLTIRYGSTSTTAIYVPASGSLQAALDQVQPGGTITLQAGATYIGNFRLPAKGGPVVDRLCGPDSVTTARPYVTITTANASLPPAGTRIDPSYKSRLATIRSSNGTAALRTNLGASYYRIVGVNFEANVGGGGDVITLGNDAQTTLSEVAHHIELDRVLISGDPAVGQRRGVSVQAKYVTIKNSDIRDIKAVGFDAQAIAGWNTPGQIVITNNLLEAAGENIMFGGANINIPSLVPCDIVIERNLLTKDTAWRGSSWTVKNLLELKNARRVRISHNILEYNWQAAQTGFAVVLTPRNTSGRTPWVTVEDIEFSHNVVRHVGSGFNISGHDDTGISQQTRRILIRNNLLYDIHSGTWGGTGVFAQIGGEPRDITIDHNTILHTGNIVTFYSGSYYTSSGVRVTGGPIYGFSYTNNMAKHNAYGIFGSGKSIGNGSLAYYTPGSVVTRNVFATDGSFTSNYPAGNFFPTVSAFYAGFVDGNNRDYRLLSTSPYNNAGSDGADLGCAFPVP
jgi:hypothetical protein